jgi:hypothetical protein
MKSTSQFGDADGIRRLVHRFDVLARAPHYIRQNFARADVENNHEVDVWLGSVGRSECASN